MLLRTREPRETPGKIKAKRGPSQSAPAAEDDTCWLCDGPTSDEDPMWLCLCTPEPRHVHHHCGSSDEHLILQRKRVYAS